MVGFDDDRSDLIANGCRRRSWDRNKLLHHEWLADVGIVLVYGGVEMRGECDEDWYCLSGSRWAYSLHLYLRRGVLGWSRCERLSSLDLVALETLETVALENISLERVLSVSEESDLWCAGRYWKGTVGSGQERVGVNRREFGSVMPDPRRQYHAEELFQGYLLLGLYFSRTW